MFTHTVKCPHCGASVTYDWSEFIIDSEVIDNDRGMGSETEHIIECDSFPCPNCNNDFKVSGSVWEYPEGAFNDQDLHAFI